MNLAHRRTVARLGAVAVIFAAFSSCPTNLGGLPTGTTAQASSRFLSFPRALGSCFVENAGQWDSQVQFFARTPGVDLWVTDNGVVYDFFRSQARPRAADDHDPSLRPGTSRRGHVVSMEFVGGNRSPVRGHGALEGNLNYFIGAKTRWVSGVFRYAETSSERIYPGIKARWYFDEGRPRYDLLVESGADPNQIVLRFSGSRPRAAGRELRLETSLGTVEHRDLVVYQGSGNSKTNVEAAFKVVGNTVRFDLGPYDHSKPLVIDPLVYATYIGGTGVDGVSEVTLDNGDRPVVVGSTAAADFPTKLGSYDRTLSGSSDGFVAKLRADGSGLVWGTFIGGSGDDGVMAVALNSSGNPVIAGITASDNFPVTSEANDDGYNGGIYDVFVSKLSSDGSTLIASTYVGGENLDQPHDLKLDSLGRPVIVGFTNSSLYPNLSPRPFLGGQEAFITKLSSNLTTLIYSSFWGGSSGVDQIMGVTLDSQDRPTVAGLTSSTNLPTTTGALDSTLEGHLGGFATMFSQDIATVRWSTYIDGVENDTCYGISSDAAGNVWLVGNTGSTDFPTTEGAFDRTNASPVTGADGYVMRLSSTGTLLASTLLGGIEMDSTICVSPVEGGVIVAGQSGSSTFPTTTSGFDITGQAGIFVARLNKSLSELLYSTRLNGGSMTSDGMDLTSNGDVVVVGAVRGGLPFTGHSFDDVHDYIEGYVARIATDEIGIRVSPRMLIGGIESAVGRIVLPAPAKPGGVVVALTSSTSRIEVPDRVVVPEGSKITTFTVKSHSVETASTGIVTAFLTGGEQSLYLTIVPGGLKDLEIAPDTVTGGKPIVVTITLTGPAPTGGRRIQLTSSRAAVAIPTSVSIPEGQSSISLNVSTAVVTSRRVATITAKLGFDQLQRDLILNP